MSNHELSTNTKRMIRDMGLSTEILDTRFTDNGITGTISVKVRVATEGPVSLGEPMISHDAWGSAGYTVHEHNTDTFALKMAEIAAIQEATDRFPKSKPNPKPDVDVVELEKRYKETVKNMSEELENTKKQLETERMKKKKWWVGR